MRMQYESVVLFLWAWDAGPYLHDSIVMCGIAFGLLFCMKRGVGAQFQWFSLGLSSCCSSICKHIYSSHTLRYGGTNTELVKGSAQHFVFIILHLIRGPQWDKDPQELVLAQSRYLIIPERCGIFFSSLHR